jgi:5-methylcytosine-specific restriction endonuclease McrA
VAGRTAQAMARLARELRTRPLLREAVRRGEVTARKAQAVLPAARGEAEERWVARARTETVRALEAAVRRGDDELGAEAEGAGAQAGPGTPRCPRIAGAVDEHWERLSVALSSEERATVDEAMALAGKILGPTAPAWQRLEAICQEFLAAHPAELSSDEVATDSMLHGRIEGWLEAAKRALEEDSEQWKWLERIEPVAAPAGPGEEGPVEPHRVDTELRQLVSMRDRWDEVMGHLALLLRMLGLWRDMGFASFAHYCTERLGMAARTVEQRVWLERRLYALPGLREAMREGRLSYEKARLVAGCADEGSVEAWIARAEGMTCIALRRAIDSGEEKQLCAQGEIAVRVPDSVSALVSSAFTAARELSLSQGGCWLSGTECLVRISQHFIDTWKAPLAERRTPERRILARDGGRCQVPGCSRAATHAHHLIYRSQGGGDEPENLLGLCAAHHLHGIHAGFIRVEGRAPDRLRWELGLRPGAPPLLEVMS